MLFMELLSTGGASLFESEGTLFRESAEGSNEGMGGRLDKEGPPRLSLFGILRDDDDSMPVLLSPP